MDISVDRDDASSWETFTVRSQTKLLVFISQFDLVLYVKLELDWLFGPAGNKLADITESEIIIYSVYLTKFCMEGTALCNAKR